MPYRYTLAGSPVYFKTPKETWIDSFQSLLDDQFENTTSLETIQEETSFSSGTLAYVTVRLTDAIDSQTGTKMGSDFKTILFQDLAHITGIGYKYYFGGNYWVVTNTQRMNNLSIGPTVRRCNAVLRWMGDDGTEYSEPCAIDYEIARPRDKVGSKYPVTPQGYINVYAQLNDNTALIKGDQRFLFGRAGNRIAYKVFGNGVRSFLNEETMDDESGALLLLIMGGDYVDEDVDNISDGIADYHWDFGTLDSGSSVGTFDIVASPSQNKIIESGSAVYDVHYYYAGVSQSGSFVFSVVAGDVPVANYTFNAIDANSFSVVNNEKYLEDTLDILCSGSSGSRVLSLRLRGAW